MEHLDTEYSIEFDELRKHRMEVSYYKYGPIKENYTKGLIDCIKTLEKCLKKYKETGNTEYLCDVANYCMIEFMYPQHRAAYFKATDSSESAGIEGMSIKEIQDKYEM